MKSSEKLALATHTDGVNVYKLNTISYSFYVWSHDKWVKCHNPIKNKLTPLDNFCIDGYRAGASEASMGVSLWDCR